MTNSLQRSHTNLRRFSEFTDVGHAQSVWDPMRDLQQGTGRSGKCDKDPTNLLKHTLRAFSVESFKPFQYLGICYSTLSESWSTQLLHFQYQVQVDMTCEIKHWGQEQVQWLVQKITRGFAKHRYKVTTNVVNLSNGPDFWVQQDCCPCPWWVTLSSAISSLENKMLSRAKVRESGFLLPTTLSSHVLGLCLQSRSSCLPEYGLPGPQTMLLNLN